MAALETLRWRHKGDDSDSNSEELEIDSRCKGCKKERLGRNSSGAVRVAKEDNVEGEGARFKSRPGVSEAGTRSGPALKGMVISKVTPAQCQVRDPADNVALILETNEKTKTGMSASSGMT